MEISLQPGRHILAVSGGVDSMVLLDILACQKADIIVAHFDHGIRPDSGLDADLVSSVAVKHGLSLEVGKAELGFGASEEQARKARYQFFYRLRNQYEARAIITAHHADDRLETAIFNIIRGTGRHGLSSLSSSSEIVRPLLGYPKKEIYTYAAEHELAWRDDSTNSDTHYSRNHIRLNILPRLHQNDQQSLLGLLDQAAVRNQKIDSLLAELPASRLFFRSLPHAVARELMAHWLRRNDVPDVDRKMLERLVRAAKIAPPGTRIDARAGWYLRVSRNDLALQRAER